MKIHGYAKKSVRGRLYNIWGGITARCSNMDYHLYPYYGAKGVKLCSDWVDYTNFHKWSLDNGYQEQLVLDRRDSNGDYEPSNCQWITRAENVVRTARPVIRDDGVLFTSAEEVAQITTYSCTGVRVNIRLNRPINRHYYYWYELQGPCLPSIT